MALLSDQQREKLKQAGIRAPHVDETCIGCCACMAICPDVYDISDEGMSVVQELENYEWLWVEDSISACPTNSISWK